MFADDNNVLNTINELIQKSILYIIYLTRRLPNILVKSMVIKISPRQIQVDALRKTGQQEYVNDLNVDNTAHELVKTGRLKIHYGYY